MNKSKNSKNKLLLFLCCILIPLLMSNGKVFSEELDKKAEAEIPRIQLVEYTGGYTYVFASLKDLTHIVCPVNIGITPHSAEKAFELSKNGKNAFVKILPKQVGESLEYIDGPRGLFVECGTKMFSLMLIPKDTPPLTIILKYSSIDKEKASEYEKSDSFDNIMQDLIYQAYLEQVPDGYDPLYVNKVIEEYNEVSVSLIKKYIGNRYSVYEYLLLAKKDITLDERQFMGFLKIPKAISIYPPSLKKSEQARMFIVSLNEDNTDE